MDFEVNDIPFQRKDGCLFRIYAPVVTMDDGTEQRRLQVFHEGVLLNRDDRRDYGDVDTAISAGLTYAKTAKVEAPNFDDDDDYMSDAIERN